MTVWCDGVYVGCCLLVCVQYSNCTVELGMSAKQLKQLEDSMVHDWDSVVRTSHYDHHTLRFLFYIFGKVIEKCKVILIFTLR